MMLDRYLKNAATGAPVHTWPVQDLRLRFGTKRPSRYVQMALPTIFDAHCTLKLQPSFIAKETVMRAAVVHQFGEPLTIEDRPIPDPGPGQITVRTEASGLCHTDIHAAHGDWPVKPTPPFVPGHEGVGIVYAAGEGASNVAIGDRVAVPWLGYACGTCKHCQTGWETLCLKQQNTGYSVDGSYAEYFLAQAAYAAKVPAGVDPNEAAPLTCAGVTTYKAGKGRQCPADRSSSDFRHRRAWPSGAPVREDLWRHRRGH
jgi:hypothetical protein